MPFATREQLIGATKLPRKIIDAPEIGGDVKLIVQAPTVYQLGQLEASMHDRDGNRLMDRVARTRERVAIMCIVDESGKPLFSELDMDELGKLPSSLLDRVLVAYREMSVVGDVEGIAGN